MNPRYNQGEGGKVIGSDELSVPESYRFPAEWNAAFRGLVRGICERVEDIRGIHTAEEVAVGVKQRKVPQILGQKALVSFNQADYHQKILEAMDFLKGEGWLVETKTVRPDRFNVAINPEVDWRELLGPDPLANELLRNPIINVTDTTE